MNLLLPGTAVLLSGLTAVLLLPVARRLGFLDRPGGRKGHPLATPLVGGLPLFLAGWLLPAWAGEPAPPLALVGLGTALVVGGLDDRWPGGLGWRLKLCGQAMAGLLVGAGLFPGAPAHWVLFALLGAVLQNALNFQDNMNGLCAGTGLILCLTLSGQGPPWAAAAAFCLAGALLPLLLGNFPVARLFLGDQGSLLIGLSLALLVSAPDPGALVPSRPALLLVPALPVLDLLATLFFRARHGLPLNRADRNHLSHRLSRFGLGDRLAVVLLWVGATLLALTAPAGAEALAGWIRGS